ncbi:hypothetical protein EDC30_10389 [Paucimonas lemoignei]|uniref:Transmembrane protein n=1 Tax=Paucimonas lemoignei TaxID=29443 RepID=A0A4R3HWX0_PAULE|nr:hypothetical protein [Paucimonas lemoignei]TCS37797.1 hypothetical protein EDC30_10389 [Paucimonas lemoignei]
MPRGWFCLLLLPVFILALPAHAGNISFNLTINGNRLLLSNQGDSPAFDPVVMRLLDNGHWEVLPPAAGSPTPVEFRPQAQAEMVWTEQPAPPSPASLETLRPVMVRFFDQAGASFGQISFFNQPQPAGSDLILDAGYEHGKLRIAPPKNPEHKVSWLVWAQEEGIAALTDSLTTPQPQPDALRIQWGKDSKEQNLDLGKGLPTAFLLHETPQGLRLQVVPTGRAPGRQQRTAWLDRGDRFRSAAMIALLAGLALLAWHVAGTRQRHSI